MKRISFLVTPPEGHLIQRIVDRAAREKMVSNRIDDPTKDRTSLAMDLTAAHANGNPIDFERLLHAPKMDFWHDVGGIRHHIDRNTGELTECFSPRTSMPACRKCRLVSSVRIKTPDAYECEACKVEFVRANPLTDDRCEVQPDPRPAQKIYEDLKPGPGKD